ncbi:predicted protein [Naegleria gruberi]|uniref:Predicted protein n=1 Tax=Naegleria gruberi TaxID=5762 RepID=D2V1N8_NAEGR|nr:uncharacterized protein NAEGRDRAFT_62641 [Naegleria gruberi]EFC49342.1 predicted protein [Naegleria gruberi]|eukprot:XP_002682086.1 predicted protein [Naegleria gruberi strain NEG-M]
MQSRDDHQLACVPEEILIDHFLPFVHHKALISLKTTNQYFNKLVWDYWIKYKTSYSIPYGIACGRFENIYKHFLCKLANLTEIGAEKSLDDDGFCQQLDDFSLFKMLESLSGKLKKLDLARYDTLCGNFIQDIAEKKIPALYTIEEMLIRDIDFELQNMTMEAFENLKKLVLIGKDAVDIEFDTFKFPPSLETLVLDYELPDTFVASIGKQCPNLTDLRVKGVSDDVAIELIESLPKLTSFHVTLDESCTTMSSSFFSIFKKKGITLNISSISLPYSINTKSAINPFGIYSEKLTYLGLYCTGLEMNDILLNSIVCLKNLKKLKLVFDVEEVKFTSKCLHSLSNNSTLKHLESLTCTLNSGAGSLVPIIVDNAIKEINLQGEEEEYFDFSFLKRCSNIETLNLDFETENNNLSATLSSKIHLPNLRTVSGKLFTCNIVNLLPNKQNIKSLKMVYDSDMDLTQFKTLKNLELSLNVCLPNDIVLPLSLNNLEVFSHIVDPSYTGFINNILALKNLRILKLKMECLQNETVATICTKDSPIEELLIGGSKFLTNSITHHFTSMENLRNLMVIDCREFKDCNEISLLEYERNFHMFSSKIKERKFDFEKAYSTVNEELKSRLMMETYKSIDTLFQELHTTHFTKLMKERKLIELNLCACSVLTLLKEKGLRLERDNEFWLFYYLLLSTNSDFMPLHQNDMLKFVNSVFARLNEGILSQEQIARLQFCCSNSIEPFIKGASYGIVLAILSILLDLNDLDTISKISSSLPQALFMVNPQLVKTVTKFMERCVREKDCLLQIFSFPDLFLILSTISFSMEITSTPSFSEFCHAITSAYCFNINCPAVMAQYFEKFSSIQHIYNPFTNLSAKVKKEKEAFRKVDPLDVSIPTRERVSIAVDPAWADKNTYVDCIDISHGFNVELFKKIKSHTFEAFGFKWYLSIQNGEYLGEVRTSLHLDSVHSTNPDEISLQLDHLQVKVLFMNFNFDPSYYYVKTHKFKFKDDFVSDNVYYNKDPYEKSLTEFNYRTIICIKLLEKKMKQVHPLTTFPNNPLNYLSNKHPWLSRQISKERPIHHETITILTPLETLVDDCFSSDTIHAFGNNVHFYIKPKSRKSGLFAVDLTDQFIPTDLYKVKYLFANESFDMDSVQIGKYERKSEIEMDLEDTPYIDSELDYNLFEPTFHQPTVIEREPGKFFNKYVFQLVLVLSNTAHGLDIGNPYDDMDDDDDWEDM